MLNQFDIDMMANDVRDIIKLWGLKLTIYKPLPIDQQINWNELLHEYSGSIVFDIYNNVVAERKDQQNLLSYGLDTTSQAGDKANSRLMFTMSDEYKFVDETCRIIYENLMYHIVYIKPRIGETVIIVDRYDGWNEVWESVNDIINCDGIKC